MIFGINETFHVKGKGIEPQIMVRPSRSPMLPFLPRLWMVVGLGTLIVTLKVSSWGPQKNKGRWNGLGRLAFRRVLFIGGTYSSSGTSLQLLCILLKGLHIIKKR